MIEGEKKPMTFSTEEKEQIAKAFEEVKRGELASPAQK